MYDRPTVPELLAAVRAFLEDDVVPALEGRRRFHALVAANVLAIAERQLAREAEALAAEWHALAALAGEAGAPPAGPAGLRAGVRRLSEALCERIRRGDADAGPFRDAVVAQVRAAVLEKLRVANPRLLR